MYLHKGIKPFFVISRYNEDFNWIYNYTENFLIYNKGEPIEGDSRILNVSNIGKNIRDIPEFIYSKYDNLPDLILFIQANPWDHCKKEIFDELIQRDTFTPIEYYGAIPANSWEGRTLDGGFMEINNSWYISATKPETDTECKYSSFDEFMNKYFDNYAAMEFIRFAPGAQYLITKEEGLQYPRSFWESLKLEMQGRNSIEGYIIERALWLIFTHPFNLRKEFFE